MNFFKKIGTVETLGSELAQLESRRTALQGKLAGAEAALEQARAEQREFLITHDGDGDAKVRNKLDAKLTKCERGESALREGLAEIETRLTDTRKRFAAARDIELREKAASERETSADAIETAALQLEKSIEALAISFENLVAVIPDDHGAKVYEYLIGARPAEPIEAATAHCDSSAPPPDSRKRIFALRRGLEEMTIEPCPCLKENPRLEPSSMRRPLAVECGLAHLMADNLEAFQEADRQTFMKISYHESGHVVAAAAIQTPIRFVTIGGSPYTAYESNSGGNTLLPIMVRSFAGDVAMAVGANSLWRPSYQFLTDYIERAKSGLTGSCDRCHESTALVRYLDLD